MQQPVAPAPATPAAPAAPAPVSVALGSGADTLVLKISQTAWQGSAQYTIKIDGVQVGGVQTASAWHSAGQSDTVTVKGDWAGGDHKVEVTFVNDAWGGTDATDRNLHVDGASYNGTPIAGAAKTLLGANPPDIFTFHDQSPVSTAVSGVTQTSTATGLVVSGSASADTLTGGAGRDTISGNGGKDVISGGAGADQLFGNGGDDVLKGELGNDFLNGGPGNDVLTGGAGADLFGFRAAQGADRVTDFAPGADKLRLVGMTAADIGIAAHVDAGVSGTLVAFGAGGSVFLAGVASLGAGDILFV
jgi:Ca2+-binding RTX toxin-like protein